MAARVTMLCLLCLFCGALAQSDVEAMTVYDILSKVPAGQAVTLDDLFPMSMVDDDGVVLESLEDSPDDVTNLELANTELLGGCSHGDCKYCTKKEFGVTFCIEAKTIKLGFDLKITANNRELFHKEISIANPPPICIKAPLVGAVCIKIYNVDLKERSACVSVTFKVKIGPIHKTVTLKIACFKIGKHEETPLIFTKMLQELVNKQLTNVE